MTTLLPMDPADAAVLVDENARLRAQVEALHIALADGIESLLSLKPPTRQGQWRRAINRLCAAAGRPSIYPIGRDLADHPRRERQHAQIAGGRA